MSIQIEIDADQLTLDDLIMVDELTAGAIPARSLKDFIGRFIIIDGQHPTPDEARRAAGKLTMGQIKQAFEAMRGKIQELQATAIPPEMSSD